MRGCGVFTETGASPEDLETMFQLIYLSFTAPRQDSSAFVAYQCRMRGSTGLFEWNRQNQYDLNSMGRVLEIKLREVLCEDQGRTYDVGVRTSSSHYLDGGYSITVSFGCAPERVEDLTEVVLPRSTV